MSQNHRFAIRFYVYFAACVSAILTTRMFSDWGGGQEFELAVIMGITIDGGKLICEAHAVRCWRKELSASTLFFVILSVVFLGMSGMATKVFLSSMDEKTENSLIKNSNEYQTKIVQLSLLEKAIKARIEDTEDPKGDPKKIERSKRDYERDMKKYEALSLELQSLSFETPIKRTMTKLNLTTREVDLIYWVLSFAIEVCQLMALIVLNGDPMADKASRSTELDNETPLSEDEYYSLASKLVDSSDRYLTYSSMRRGLKCSTKMVSIIFKRFRDNGVLKLEGNRHVRIV